MSNPIQNRLRGWFGLSGAGRSVILLSVALVVVWLGYAAFLALA